MMDLAKVSPTGTHVDTVDDASSNCTDMTSRPVLIDLPVERQEDAATKGAESQNTTQTVPATIRGKVSSAQTAEQPACSGWQPPVYAEHEEGDAIRRQVEFYFSDENLPSDAHLLMKTGGSKNLPVSVRHICGFARMRKYKPYRSVVESLKKSTFLDVIDDKYLQRKIPLALSPTVEPERTETARKDKGPATTAQAVEHKPWVTKGMRKPTGFEEYATDAPVTPGEFLQEQELYDREISFNSRIETAISRYTSKRKFHQQTAFIFGKFMKYGGIEGGQKQFSGGLSAGDLENRNAAEIAAITSTHKILDDINTHEDNWEVDFEAVAKGYLSSQMILSHLRYSDQSEIMTTTNILRNFYNYLLHHTVCPEYDVQIYAARRICDLADQELYKTIYVGSQLPHDFNSAVSRLHDGALASVFSEGQTWDGAENFGGSEKDSQDIMMAAISALGTEDQYEAASRTSRFEVVCEEETIFEVTSVELADAETRALYEAARQTKHFLKTVGRLHCRRWTYPLARRPTDQGIEALKVPQNFTLFVEDSVLEHCFAGMKIEGVVKGLDIGIWWLDRVYTVSPSFFVLLPNEFWDKQQAAKREESSIYQATDLSV